MVARNEAGGVCINGGRDEREEDHIGPVGILRNLTCILLKYGSNGTFGAEE